jgi:hypothetical protein
MIKNLEEQKDTVKKRIIKVVDEYYKKFESSSGQKEFNINKIEQLMMENQKKLKEVMSEANNELTSNVKTDVKKNALDVNPN